MKKPNKYCGHYKEVPQNKLTSCLPINISQEDVPSLAAKLYAYQSAVDEFKSGDMDVHYADNKTETISVADWFAKIYDVLDPFLNLSPGDRQLYINWLMGYFNNGTTLPILIIDGPEGSGKSTLCAITQAIVNNENFRNYFCRKKQDAKPVTLTGQETAFDVIDTIKQRELTVYENVSALTTEQITGLIAAGCAPSPGLSLNKHKAVILTTTALPITDPDLLDHSIRLELPPLKAVRPQQDILNELEQKMPDIYKASVALLACLLSFYLIFRGMSTVKEDEPEKLKILYDYVLLGHLTDNMIYEVNNFYPYFVRTQLPPISSSIVPGPVT